MKRSRPTAGPTRRRGTMAPGGLFLIGEIGDGSLYLFAEDSKLPGNNRVFHMARALAGE